MTGIDRLFATVVPYNGQSLDYLTVWPTGESRPVVSTLNNLTSTIVANATIVAAGTNGQIAVYPSNNTHLVVDINGYFAPAGMGGFQEEWDRKRDQQNLLLEIQRELDRQQTAVLARCTELQRKLDDPVGF